jgi:Zn finger protein HypA/HybF involved in hydrogenase expression
MTKPTLNDLKTNTEVNGSFYYKDIRNGMISFIITSDKYAFINGTDVAMEYLNWLVSEANYTVEDIDICYGGKYNGITEDQLTVVYDKTTNSFHKDTIEPFDCQPYGDYESTQFFLRAPSEKKSKTQIKKDKEFRVKYLELSNKLQDFDRTIVARINQQKSKFKTCPSCESKLNAAKVFSVGCPLCGSQDFGYTTTDKTNKIKLQEKIEAGKERFYSIPKDI